MKGLPLGDISETSKGAKVEIRNRIPDERQSILSPETKERKGPGKQHSYEEVRGGEVQIGNMETRQ